LTAAPAGTPSLWSLAASRTASIWRLNHTPAAPSTARPLDTRVLVASSRAPSSRRRPVRRVGNLDILSTVLRGAIAHAAADPRGLRTQLLKNLWIEIKRFGAPHVVNIEPSWIRGIDGVAVEGPITRQSSLVLCALGALLGCERIFEFGTYRGDTTWLLAHNLPRARVYTLDLAGPDATGSAELELTDAGEYFMEWDRGVRFRDTPEASRITRLVGDSAAFDFSPYRGTMDLIYIDASHSFSYVKSDTEAALAMLSPTGTIVWDDYTHYSGIWAYLDDLGSAPRGPIYHLLGTRLALYSRRDLLVSAGERQPIGALPLSRR
jgi:predicted O-methyltransferase YrrM